MTRPRLLHGLSRIRNYQNFQRLSTLVLLIAFFLHAGSSHSRSKILQGRVSIAHSQVDRQPLTEGQTLKISQRYTRLLDLLQIDAAIQHRFFVPSPRPLPGLTRIDGQGIQNQNQGTQSTIGRFGLGRKLLNQRKKRFQPARGKRRRENPFPLLGRKRCTSLFWKLSLIKGRHGLFVDGSCCWRGHRRRWGHYVVRSCFES
mmetsp:Transcript_113481/g.169762  ORF Transcript_113481/g.169762 Transcript_113481/m.169762 type:complete len:201 (+) Transcript_113481:821-1423(+)